MPVLYRCIHIDNVHRANRVNQLAGDIAHIQTQVKEAAEDAAIQDERAVTILDAIAKQRGFKTIEELVAAAEKQLTPEDRQKYQDMQRAYDKKDERISVALKSGLGLICIGIKAGMTGVAVSALFQRTLLKVTLQAVGLGLVKIVSGELSLGADILGVSGKILGSIVKGEELVGKVATAFKVIKIASKIVTILGVALEAINLIYEAIDEGTQREEFRKATKDLCVRRLTTKKIYQYTAVTLSYSSEAKAIVDFSGTVQDLVKDGSMTQAAADNRVRDMMVKLEPKMTQAINNLDDKTIYDKLRDQDKAYNAWTNEDPSFEQIEAMVEQELKEEK